jgi:hypothetical protein
MLPDLWRMADRRVRPSLQPLAATGSPRVDEVNAGIDHHHRVDAAFHESALFRDGEAAIMRALREIPAPRLSLFGHIAFELCLDGALVRREGEALLEDVRAAIAVAADASAGESPVEAAARLHYATRKSEPLPDRFQARVAWLLGEVARGPWVEGYARGAQVADRIDGIRKSLGFPTVEGADREQLVRVLDDAIARAEDEIGAAFALDVRAA